MLTIRGYGEMSEQTALDVAAMVDTHDRIGQAPRFCSTLRREIVTALGVTDTRAALNIARRAAAVLAKLGIRDRPEHLHRNPRFAPALAGDVPDRRRKPRATAST